MHLCLRPCLPELTDLFVKVSMKHLARNSDLRGESEKAPNIQIQSLVMANKIGVANFGVAYKKMGVYPLPSLERHNQQPPPIIYHISVLVTK